MGNLANPNERAFSEGPERRRLASLFARVDELDAQAAFAEATALLASAARAGSLDAMAELGARTALGAGTSPDCSAGAALLEFAADRGHAGAGQWIARLALSGAAPEPVTARIIGFLARDARAGDSASLTDLAELAGELGTPDYDCIDSYIEAAKGGIWDAPLALELASEDPLIGECRDLLPLSTCRRIAADAMPVLAPAGVTDRESGAFALDAVRTNTSAQVAFFAQPVALLAAKRRIAASARQQPMHLERTNVLRYLPGQSFAPHWDYLDPTAPGFGAELAAQGQRVATCLIGLSNDYSGGETHFPELDIRLRVQAGNALFFRNVDVDGQPDPRTLHAGLGVTSGEKVVVSQWVRTRRNPL